MDIPNLSLEMRIKRGFPRFKFRTRKKALAQLDYFGDNLAVWGKTCDFLRDPKFIEAYMFGMDSGHHIMRPPGSTSDIHIEWRVQVCLWAAQHAKILAGDFVECGVNTGILARAVCKYTDFNATGKKFFLFDTFCGIPESQAGEDAVRVRETNAKNYEECYELAKRNFSAYPGATLVRGMIPDKLTTVPIDKVAYLSIDMNVSAPEIAAIEFFWGKLSRGAPVVLDDYGWYGHEKQKAAFDTFARERGVEILMMPTGQGLLIKP